MVSACSSLVTVVKIGRSRVVQFSHLSVEEFLMPDCLAGASGDVSRYHPPACTYDSCASLLLESSWVKHAQFESASSRIEDGMDRLF
jgi:hypothetical protein